LYGQYSFTNSQSQVGLLASNRSLGPGFGFTLSWTILDNLSTFTQLKNLDLQRENAELAVESNNQQIEKEVKLAMSNYNYAKELYALENSAVIKTEEIFKIAQQTYEAGSMTDLELREFQFSVVQAKNRQLSAALSMKTAELNLNLMTGNFKNLIK
jgi:outer membrane protein TolC